jgi:hypothetical protein
VGIVLEAEAEEVFVRKLFIAFFNAIKTIEQKNQAKKEKKERREKKTYVLLMSPDVFFS